MERLEKLINILKLTPHRQPELVKEASHRILSRSMRTDPQIGYLLKPLIEILIYYCDNNDSAQRSIFNDYLNSVILTFQYQYYQLILQVLLDEVTNNGSARTVTTSLQRIPHLIQNVQPIELGCEPQKLLITLIEVARRADDESVLKALDSALKQIMPYLSHHIRRSKELLTNSLIEILLKNLQNESSQVKRLAASSIATICSNSDLILQNTLTKLEVQLKELSTNTNEEHSSTDKFIGFCLIVKELPKLAELHHVAIIKMILDQLEVNYLDLSLVTAALELLRELFKFPIDHRIIDHCSSLIDEKFLFVELEGRRVIQKNTKVIHQTNALACIASIVKQRPTTLDHLDYIFLFKNHSDVAIRNQLIIIIGNYIEASWRFPLCIDHSVDCEKIRKLWLELRSILYEENAHPDTLKTCVNAIKTCANTLLESDHCLHIIEFSDFNHLIQLYLKSNFKPFKIEVLNLFANLNYRTLHYLERSHWVRMKSQSAGSLIESLQDRVVNKLIIASLVDEHQRIRNAASSALITIIPNLFIYNLDSGHKNIFHRNSDPIVSLACDLASEHLVMLELADEHTNNSNNYGLPISSSESHDKLSIRNSHTFLSSSIIQQYDNHNSELSSSRIDLTRASNKVNISINLMYVVGLLRTSMEESIYKGKNCVSSIVRSLYELSLVYPIYQYSASWDCRASEYCESFVLLNFILTYLENLTEPDVVIEDLEAYKNFLSLSHQLLYALCHESVLAEYEHQRMKPFHKRQANVRDGYWSELTLKHPCIENILETYFAHLVKLLSLITNIIEERGNPFSVNPKQATTKEQKLSNFTQEATLNHAELTTNQLLFSRIHKKLESSFRSSKKNLNQRDEKFSQILDICLSSMASLLEFISMGKSLDHIKDILNYLRITSPSCMISSLVVARQLLKSLFGINILALYQLDPNDWFEDELWPSVQSNLMSQSQENTCASLQGVYHHLISHPYKLFSSYYSAKSSLTPTSDRALAMLNFQSRRALKVRRRIEERVKSLFEYNPLQLIAPKVRQLSEILKSTITEFTPIVTVCMSQFTTRGFCQYQSEILHFMSYLILLRVNYHKLALASDLIISVNRLLDQCAEKVFLYREEGIETLLRNSFTFLSLLSYERGPSKPMFTVATVIQKLDDIRAKLSMATASEKDITTYVVPLLRCLVEDLFIYRTKYFQDACNRFEAESQNVVANYEKSDQSKKDAYEILEAERETVAQKLLDVIDNPKVYDLLSILILESRQNLNEIKYKKLSQHLLSIIPTMLTERRVDLRDYRCIELTRRIIENITPEVFQPVNFIFETLLQAAKPPAGIRFSLEFQRWMSLVIIAMHILINQVKEEVFLSRLRETMLEEEFVEDLFHILQISTSEILLYLDSPAFRVNNSEITFLSQQLSSYMLYLTHMFQSGTFFQLSKSAAELIRRKLQEGSKGPKSFRKLCGWARDPHNGFSLYACEKMFCNLKLVYPDLTIFWCNIMMLLNNVDCNRDYWRDLLVYECHHCKTSDNLSRSTQKLSVDSSTEESVIDCTLDDLKDESKFKRSPHINRPSSLNLSEITFNDQLRRSFIKRIAAVETRDKPLNRNIIETSGEDGKLLEREVNIGNAEQCLSPNIELTRRGALCLVLDFVTISMNDVEHITWLIIHYINDIIRWSHELPITEFINAIHGNSASSGIFIQAINSGCANPTSISFVARLLWTLQNVHYTQYGSLVVLLVEKLLSSPELMIYRSLTRSIEEFACETVQKLLNETNKNLVTTNDEVLNQLAAEDLDRVSSLLDVNLYPKLTKLLSELRDTTTIQGSTPTIKLHAVDQYSDYDSDDDEIDVLYSKAKLVLWLADKKCTSRISTLFPALSKIRTYLLDPKTIERINKDNKLACLLVSAVYSLVLNILPPPARLSAPRFWTSTSEASTPVNGERPTTPLAKPVIHMQSKRPVAEISDQKFSISKSKPVTSKDESVEACRIACLKGLFLMENIDYLQTTQYEHLSEIIIRVARFALVNSFILTPPLLWRQNIWPPKFSDNDPYKITFPMVTHGLLSKDFGLLDNFCDRLLRLGWTSRRQFEEAWMALLGVLSASLSPLDKTSDSVGYESEKKTNLLISCKVITTITKLLLLTRKTIMGDPLSEDSHSTQSFDERVIELTRKIGTNLSSLRKKTKTIFESIEQEKNSNYTESNPSSPINNERSKTEFSDYLRVSAQALRMNIILNVELDMQDTVVIDGESDKLKNDHVDVESCIRLLLSIYKQKFRDPNEILYSSSSHDQPNNQSRQSPSKNRTNQLAPPLTTAICQSIIALSDMFTEYDQFDWLFESLVQMFKLADRNDDDIQLQYLIVGLCKATTICCYEIPNELTTTISMNFRDVMFEKCRQTIEKCVKSKFCPLKLNALFGIYYMLEDSINIVASGAWELDHFKQLRQSRLNWITRLMPILLDIDNSRLLTKRNNILKLLEALYEIVPEFEVRAIKS